jgi:purine-binding chemotaxis protein CheW
MIVDAVTEVLRISTTQIEPPSTMSAAGGSDYIVGIAKLEERLVLLLDLERVLTTAINGEVGVELLQAA